MNACKDCKYFHLDFMWRFPFKDYSMAECKKFEQPYDYTSTSVLTGKTKREVGVYRPRCWRIRNDPFSCSHEGKFFEPKG